MPPVIQNKLMTASIGSLEKDEVKDLESREF
jgi:hypothetical protein